MSEHLLQLEKDLRSAVARRRYTEVPKVAAEFCAQAAEEWGALPAGDPRARDIFDRLQNLLEWARLMVCTSRASLEGELRQALFTHRYLTTGSTSSSRLRFDI